MLCAAWSARSACQWQAFQAWLLVRWPPERCSCPFQRLCHALHCRQHHHQCQLRARAGHIRPRRRHRQQHHPRLPVRVAVLRPGLQVRTHTPLSPRKPALPASEHGCTGRAGSTAHCQQCQIGVPSRGSAACMHAHRSAQYMCVEVTCMRLLPQVDGPRRAHVPGERAQHHLRACQQLRQQPGVQAGRLRLAHRPGPEHRQCHCNGQMTHVAPVHRHAASPVRSALLQQSAQARLAQPDNEVTPKTFTSR